MQFACSHSQILAPSLTPLLAAILKIPHQGFRQRVEGMVHVSNMSKRPVSSAKDVVKRGMEVWVKVRQGGVGTWTK